MDCKIQKTIVKSKQKEVRWSRWKINDSTKERLVKYYDIINKYPSQNELKMLSDQFEICIKNIKTFFQNRRQRSKINNRDIINFEDKLNIDDKYIESVYDYHETNIILEQFEKNDEDIQLNKLNLEYNELHYISIFSEQLENLYKIKFDYIADFNIIDELKFEYLKKLNLEYIRNFSILEKNIDKYISNILDIIIN